MQGECKELRYVVRYKRGKKVESFEYENPVDAGQAYSLVRNNKNIRELVLLNPDGSLLMRKAE